MTSLFLCELYRSRLTFHKVDRHLFSKTAFDVGASQLSKSAVNFNFSSDSLVGVKIRSCNSFRSLFLERSCFWCQLSSDEKKSQTVLELMECSLWLLLEGTGPPKDKILCGNLFLIHTHCK